MILFQYVTESDWKVTYLHKKLCKISLNQEIEFHETFEITSTAKLNSREIGKFFSPNREIKLRENVFP